MGAVILGILACAAEPPGPLAAPLVGAVTLGWEDDAAIFTAGFWTTTEPATVTVQGVVAGCAILAEEPAVLVPASAGEIHLVAPGFEVSSRPEDLYGAVFYPPPDLTGLPWGELLTIFADGDEIPAFSGTLHLPALPEDLAIGPDPAVRWSPAGRDQVEISVEAGAKPGIRWWCPTSDDGAWSVPSALRADPDVLRVAWRAAEERRIAVDDAAVALRGWTGATGAIPVVGSSE